ncbi:MAG: DUF2326 domain-containing protein [Bacteroidetes bacterium]|nr:DUF2326 domain-containing protein [Bacteroidota bacterium]
MKLSRLYSNKPELFEPIDFAQGLNVVFAEIHLPENRNKDTHNLGKSTLGRLLDFCFLAGRDQRFFLFKHFELFREFVFYLEIELEDKSYITIRRTVEESSKISFKRHKTAHQDFTTSSLYEWDHQEVPFERAKDLLDGVLDLRSVKPWDYRKGLGYLLRSQDDFNDIFQLNKFKGAHSEWKPFLAHILGFDDSLIQQHYHKEQQLNDALSREQTINSELRGSIQDVSKIEGILLLKQAEAHKKQQLLEAFDFRTQDKNNNKELVESIDERISELNSERYSLTQSRKKIIASLEEDQILFNPEEAKRLFLEAGILFEGQIKRDYEQLIAFNRAITDERRGYLQEERSEIETLLKKINSELTVLGKKRSEMLSFLSSTDIFAKFKQVSNELITLKADITTLERQRTFLHRLQELRSQIRSLADERSNLQIQIESDVEKQNSDQQSHFSSIRLYFSEIVEEVIDRKALLSVSPNKEGHLEFKAEILDTTGNATSADLGHTYRKLLCIAFDLAILRSHLDCRFPRFTYHDGVFESLDNRKKEKLLTVIRQYADLGLQPLITLIDSDLPSRSELEPVFIEEEIVLRLHDDGNEGRLFKMDPW